MSNSDNEERNHARMVVLTGPVNYNEWLRYIKNKLLDVDLMDIVEGDELQLEKSEEAQRKWIKRDKKAFLKIDTSLSATVHKSVPLHLAR
jgi:hypothetical protein